MGETKELSKGTRNNTVGLLKLGMGNKKIGKQLGEKAISVGAIIRRWKKFKIIPNFLQPGALCKFSPQR